MLCVIVHSAVVIWDFFLQIHISIIFVCLLDMGFSSEELSACLRNHEFMSGIHKSEIHTVKLRELASLEQYIARFLFENLMEYVF